MNNRPQEVRIVNKNVRSIISIIGEGFQAKILTAWSKEEAAEMLYKAIKDNSTLRISSLHPTDSGEITISGWRADKILGFDVQAVSHLYKGLN